MPKLLSALFDTLLLGAFALGAVVLGVGLVASAVGELHFAVFAHDASCQLRGLRVERYTDDDEVRHAVRVQVSPPNRPELSDPLRAAAFSSANEAEAHAASLRKIPSISCLFDPKRPARIRLSRPSAEEQLAKIGFGLALLIVVPLGLYRTRGRSLFRSREAQAAQQLRSPEARSAATRAGYRQQARPGGPDQYGDLRNFPLPKLHARAGRTLPVALSADLHQSGGTAMLIFALAWNAFCIPLFISGVRGFRGAGVGGMFAILILSSFVLVGLGLLWGASKPYTKGLRKVPRVEIGHDPIQLGDELAILIEQPWVKQLDRYQVVLRCEEFVSYTVGTDTRTETHKLTEVSLLDEANLQPERGRPLARRCQLTIPPDLPASFHSEHNRIWWKLVVIADIPRFPDLEETFTLRVLPRLEP